MTDFHFGRGLRLAMTDTGWGVSDIMMKLVVSRQRVYFLQNSEHVNTATLIRVADALEITAENMFDYCLDY